MDYLQRDFTVTPLEEIEVMAKTLLVASVFLAGPTQPAEARAALFNVAIVLGHSDSALECRDAAATLPDAELLSLCRRLADCWRSKALAALRYTEVERTKTKIATQSASLYSSSLPAESGAAEPLSSMPSTPSISLAAAASSARTRS